jgi:S-adenosylhomocysteine hydrolase
MCLHVQAKSGVLVEVLRAGGAELVLTGSRTLSTVERE